MWDESTGQTTMYFEVHVAINFVTSFMNKLVPQGRIKVFGEALARALMNKYEGHWFPECPLKGSAYRCFEFGAYIEPELKLAARQAGLRCRDVLICVPSEMSIWVDPGTVSYRIGIEGPVKPVLNESGCVVTCFFDPDVEDPEPDPPGISKAVSSCEETETVEKSKPRKFTPKRGKSKLSVAYEDLTFVSKNGGLDSATECDDLEPLEPYFTTEDLKSGILCEDEEFTSNQMPSTDEPAYGNSRRRRSRRSKKKSPNKVGNNNGNRGRNIDKRRQNNDSNNNSKICSNNYQNNSGSATGSVSVSGASSSGKSVSGASSSGKSVSSASSSGKSISGSTSTSSSGASTSGTSSSGTSCSSSSSSSSSGGSSSSGAGSSSSGGGSSSSSSITSSSSLTTTSSSSCTASNVNRSSTVVSGRNSRSSSGRNSRGGSNSNNTNSNPNITNTSSNSSRNSNHHRNRNVLQHQSIVISNSSYSSRV